MRHHLKAFTILLTLGLPGAAGAVEISVVSGVTPLVVVSGPFRWHDEKAFRDKTASFTKAIVLFNSPGGNLIAGMEIGTTIRMKGFATAVLDGNTCASACAFAWLGGARRVMQPRSLVGFHAVSAIVDGEQKESSGGNALAGAYLNRIGMTDRAVMYITSTPSSSITWMSPYDAAQNGIEVSLIPSTVPKRSNTGNSAQASPALTANASADQRLASSLAVAFSKKYQSSGMAGLNESIKSCYAVARTAPTADTVSYCVALDELSAAIDKSMMDHLRRPQEGPNSFGAFHARAHEFLSALGWDEKSQLARSSTIAAIASKAIAYNVPATSSTNAEIAPPAGAQIAENQDAKMQIAARCSTLADQRQLHGDERRAFRAACKAGR